MLGITSRFFRKSTIHSFHYENIIASATTGKLIEIFPNEPDIQLFMTVQMTDNNQQII